MQDKIIKTRLNDKMYDEVIRYCSEHHITTSQYIRNCLSFSLKVANRKANENKNGVESNDNWIDKYYNRYLLEQESAEKRFNDFYDEYQKERGGN